jgi:hypothetical protein
MPDDTYILDAYIQFKNGEGRYEDGGIVLVDCSWRYHPGRLQWV